MTSMLIDGRSLIMQIMLIGFHTGQCKRTGGCYNELVVAIFRTGADVKHTGQCKRTGGCYNELVVAFLRTGDGLKGKKNL